MTIESNTEVSQCLDTSILVLLKKWSTWATGWSNIVVTKAFGGYPNQSVSSVWSLMFNYIFRILIDLQTYVADDDTFDRRNTPVYAVLLCPLCNITNDYFGGHPLNSCPVITRNDQTKVDATW